MPALQFCWRRWLAASDDFVLVPSVFAAVRAALVIFSAVEFGAPNTVDTWRTAVRSSYNGTATNESAVNIDARPDHDYQTFMLGVYVVCVICIDATCFCSDLLLALSSFTGSVLEVARRQMLVPISLVIRIICTWFELGVAIFGAVFLYSGDIGDPSSYGPLYPTTFQPLLIAGRTINAIQFGFVVIIVTALVAYFDTKGKGEGKSGDWSNRCRICFCCVWAESSLGGSQEKRDTFDLAFGSVAELFSNMFLNADLVPSDIAAGLVLVRKKQRRQLRNAALCRQHRSPSMSGTLRRTLETQHARLSAQNTTVLRKLDPSDLQVLGELAFYMNFAVGAYGWPMLAMAAPVSFPTKLCSGCFCGTPKKVHEHKKYCGAAGAVANTMDSIPVFVGDNLCHCNISAIEHWLSGAQQAAESFLRGKTRGLIDVLYYSRANDVFVVPFFIAKDDDKKEVVVSIRGTLSIHDAFTDLSAVSERLAVAVPKRLTHPSSTSPNRAKYHQDSTAFNLLLNGDASVKDEVTGTVSVSGYCHKGMFHSAEALYKKLMIRSTQIGAEADACHLPTLLDACHCADYRLVLTGHSLGAGVAAILGLMLLEQFPSLKALAFSPPGGLLSQELALISETFCTTVVVGKDLVPRLSEVAVASLRDSIVVALSETARAKATILSSCCVSDVNFLFNKEKQQAVSRRGVVEPLKDEAVELLEHYRASISRDVVRETLYPPGIIWHFQKTHREKKCRCGGGEACGSAPCCVGKEDMYYPVVVPRTHFKDIIVSPVMIQDHMPYNVKTVIDETTSRAFTGKLDSLADTTSTTGLLSDDDEEQEQRGPVQASIVFDDVL